MENLVQRNDIIKQNVMYRLIDEGYKMNNKQWNKLSNFPFIVSTLENNQVKNPEKFLYTYLKHYIDNFGLPTDDEIKIMEDIEKMLFELANKK